MSEKQLKSWEGMVTKVIQWMDLHPNVLPERIAKPQTPAHENENSIAQTLKGLRAVQRELREGAPRLYSLLDEVSYTELGWYSS
jgi:hypothetical protein